MSQVMLQQAAACPMWESLEGGLALVDEVPARVVMILDMCATWRLGETATARRSFEDRCGPNLEFGTEGRGGGAVGGGAPAGCRPPLLAGYCVARTTRKPFDSKRPVGRPWLR